MTRIELDTRIAQLNADFVQERSSIDRTIIQHRVAIEELCKIHDKEVAEHKVAILNHQAYLSELKATHERKKAEVLTAYEREHEEEE